MHMSTDSFMAVADTALVGPLGLPMMPVMLARLALPPAPSCAGGPCRFALDRLFLNFLVGGSSALFSSTTNEGLSDIKVSNCGW